MPRPPVNTSEFQALVQVVEALRGPNGCPWDKEQTHQTLTQYALEEAHELAEAIDLGHKESICEELGDLLLQVVLHSEIARQSGSFTIQDVIQGITGKMIRRHPHVFSDTQVKDSTEVLANWGKIKDQEKKEKIQRTPADKESPFASIPVSLPALLRSQKIGAKTVRMNFDWSDPWQVVEKIDEELAELKEALRSQPDKPQDISIPDERQKELGDLLFSVVQLARHLDFDAEQSLRLTNKKFERRFLKMRELVENDGKVFADQTTPELEPYWLKAKAQLKE
jgi:tetrapyrrole methylase family protein/MazG family protein